VKETYLPDTSLEHTTERLNKALSTLQETSGHRFPQIFQTITADNGSDFNELTDQFQEHRPKAFFCHHYSSWEKVKTKSTTA